MTLMGWILLAVGAVGIYGGALRSVRGTLPEQAERRPGVGAFVGQLLPGWLVLCLGVGVVWETGRAALLFAGGLVGWGVAGWVVGRIVVDR